MKKAHIYVVSSEAEKGKRLVSAGSPAQVRAHLTKLFTVTLAKPQDVASLYEQGVKVEYAANE